LKDISLQARKIKIGSEAADFSVGYSFLLPLSFQLRGSLLLIRKVILPAQEEISINHDIIYYQVSKV
jgi:hypothetical protein